MSIQDFENIQRADKETCKFFAYINQFMLFYMLHSIIRLSTTDSRIDDIFDILLTFSYILMLFGVSTSIKKSLDKQVREERMKNEFDFSIDEDSPSQSLVQQPKEKPANQIRLNKINPSEDSIDEDILRAPIKDASSKRKQKGKQGTTISTQQALDN